MNQLIHHADWKGHIIRPDLRAQLEAKVQRLAAKSKSDNTRALYRTAFGSFQQFCSDGVLNGEEDPHRVLILYVGFLAEQGMRGNSITSYLSGVKYHLKALGVQIDPDHEVWFEPNPDIPGSGGFMTLGEVMAGCVKESNLNHGIAKKDALSFQELGQIIAMINDGTVAGERDRALLLIGFAGGFRRSEVAALRFDDLTFSDKGVVIRKRDSKGDRQKLGQEVGIARAEGQGAHLMCPVLALECWLEVYAESRPNGTLDARDPVFPRMFKGGTIGSTAITGKSVLDLLRKHALESGVVTQDTQERLGAHSLRAGLITTGYSQGADLRTLAQQVHHKRLDTTNGYIRNQEVFENNPTSLIFGAKP